MYGSNRKKKVIRKRYSSTETIHPHIVSSHLFRPIAVRCHKLKGRAGDMGDGKAGPEVRGRPALRAVIASDVRRM